MTGAGMSRRRLTGLSAALALAATASTSARAQSDRDSAEVFLTAVRETRVPGTLKTAYHLRLTSTWPQETVAGGTLSFFQPRFLPGVVRMEGGYFFGENTCTRIACEGWPGIGVVDTRIPQVDYVRWMLGYDVYDLNVPWLSRTNNIIIITQWFNTFRMTDVRKQDREQVARAGLPPEFAEFMLNQNPARNGLAITPASRYSAVWSVAVQSFLMHGNLNPQIIGVAFTEGDFGLLPNVVYHINDSLQVKVGVAYIFGKFSQLGLFRDRSQAGMRISYLLN